MIFVLYVGKTEGLWYFVLIFYPLFSSSTAITQLPDEDPWCHVFTGMEEQGVIKSRVHIAEFIYKKDMDARIFGVLITGIILGLMETAAQSGLNFCSSSRSC